MAHFAKVINGIVTEVIVADEEYATKLGSDWIQTSYNTHLGVHKLGGTPLRKNFAGVGYTYDSDLDAFIPPKPPGEWNLNETTGMWQPPTTKPNDGKKYYYDGFDWQERQD